MARKVAEMPGGNEAEYDVKQKVASHKHVVAKVTLKGGASVPAHSHTRGYVVHPMSKGSVTKTTYRGGKAVRQERIELTPGQPYYVPATKRGETISSKNNGRRPLTFGKIVDPGEPETFSFPGRTRRPRPKRPASKKGD